MKMIKMILSLMLYYGHQKLSIIITNDIDIVNTCRVKNYE